jgi:cobalt/nickel transport system permease protein
VAAIAVAVKVTNKKMGEKQVPMMGVLAAFIFAAQMLNFGRRWHIRAFCWSGAGCHIVGAMGYRAYIQQCAGCASLIFQDGGLLALGANITNMGIVAGFSSYYIYKGIDAIFKHAKAGTLAAAGIGAWFSSFIGALACAAELAMSGTSPWEIAVPAMGGVYMLTGIGEGLITVAVLSLIMATRADLLKLQVD